MPGHVKKTGEPDPDPTPFLFVTYEQKQKDLKRVSPSTKPNNCKEYINFPLNHFLAVRSEAVMLGADEGGRLRGGVNRGGRGR
jgi:hypothetical protein